MPLPRRGTFQDVLLQEVDFRERNLRLAEVTLFVCLLEDMLLLMIEGLNIDPKYIPEAKLKASKRIGKLISKYEAELYQDRYLPEYQRAEREISRRERQEAENKKARDEAVKARVASFDDDEE